MSVLRGVVAVVAGYLVFAVSAGLLFQLSGRNPHAPQSSVFMAAAAVYGMVFALLGGLLAMRLAARRQGLHASLVAALIALGAATSLLASPSTDATWSQWSALVLMAPAALLAPVIGGRRG